MGSGVHEQGVERLAIVGQRPVACPFDEFVELGGPQQLTQALETFAVAYQALRQGEKMQVVIAQHGNRRVAQAADETDRFQRFGAAVDQVAGQPQRVVRRIEAHGLEQPLQRIVTALQVSDRVNGH